MFEINHLLFISNKKIEHFAVISKIIKVINFI